MLLIATHLDEPNNKLINPLLRKEQNTENTLSNFDAFFDLQIKI